MQNIYKTIAKRISIELEYHAMMRETDFNHSMSCNIALTGFAESLVEDLIKVDHEFNGEEFLKLCGIKRR